MRALFRTLIILLPALAGCDRPAPADLWTSADAASQTKRTCGQSPEFQKIMAQGTRANLAGRASEAEERFREALEIQRKACGANNPELALPTMSLAMSLSNQRQFAQADAQFATAASLMRTQPDRARLEHYRGVHLLNQNQPQAADGMLRAAQNDYLALVPPDDLTRAPVERPHRNRFDINSAVGAARDQEFQITGRASNGSRPELLGLIETLRYRAIALRDLGDSAQADTLTAQAAAIARGNGLDRASVFARVYRTSGVTVAGQSNTDRALSELAVSDQSFATALPGTRPAAEAALIRAGELLRAGQTGAAVSACKRAVDTLIAISQGTTAELMAPCLDALYSGGTFGSDTNAMFLAAQVAQGSITSRQIAQASEALAQNARDPRIGAAIKKRDDWRRELDRVYRSLDTISGATGGRAADETTRLQAEADQAKAALAAADAEVRTLAPNFGQLVQDVVPASAVFSSLGPAEAFVALTLSQHEGWAFALYRGKMSVARINGGTDAVGPLVKAIRAGIEQVAAGALPTFDIDNSRRLYELTLGGVASQIQGATSLVIAPAGPLLSLPFEVLLTGPADPAKLASAPWLIRQAAITHVPAVTNFVGLRKVANTSAAGRPWFGFGQFRPMTVAQASVSFPAANCGNAARLLAGLSPLPGAAQELEKARELLGASASDELIGDNYTADQVMRLQGLKNYRILHFASHAVLPTELACQKEAAIVTSPPPGANSASGAMLTASRVLGLDLDANLVILSACNSGGPGGGGGESLSGLARSFFFARARSLLVSHWDVNDNAAAILIALTVNNLKEDGSLGIAGSIRKAQLALLERAADGRLTPEFGHPFVWAPFAVIGDGTSGLGGGPTVSSRL